MSEPSVFGRRLKAFRLRAGLSQNKLSELSGVPRPTINVVESGQQSGMSMENVVKIADALGISLDLLVRGDVLDEEPRCVAAPA